ncbi:hypothetical protein [Rufibacter sp. LB8]|uniref:hypothetical protein n=1 Tax=Rufibacter sp. LB8 TaxID=2777781 RepID=UPI00178C31BE|nr:hypothetical protein [Rufibacter sp. LB8]
MIKVSSVYKELVPCHSHRSIKILVVPMPALIKLNTVVLNDIGEGTITASIQSDANEARYTGAEDPL